MKAIICLTLFLSIAHAQTYELTEGTARFKVKIPLKSIDIESQEVKGKVVCAEECEFLLAVPIKSFTSGDSNRDLNMRDATDEGQFKWAEARGKFPPSVWSSTAETINATVKFHGVSTVYPVRISEHGRKAGFTLNLENHKIERPSLFMVKIDNEIPMTFELTWKKP